MGIQGKHKTQDSNILSHVDGPDTCATSEIKNSGTLWYWYFMKAVNSILLAGYSHEFMHDVHSVQLILNKGQFWEARNWKEALGIMIPYLVYREQILARMKGTVETAILAVPWCLWRMVLLGLLSSTAVDTNCLALGILK